MPRPLPVQIEHVKRAARKRPSIDRRLRGLDVPLPRTVQVAPALEGMGAAAQSDGKTIYTQGKVDDRTMAHEMAHLLDSQVMTVADRQRFSTIMGRPNKPWETYEKQPGSAYETTRYGSTSERFADMFSMLAAKNYPRPGYMESTYMDKMPTKRELLRFGRALERLKRRNDLQDYARPW